MPTILVSQIYIVSVGKDESSKPPFQNFLLNCSIDTRRISRLLKLTGNSRVIGNLEQFCKKHIRKLNISLWQAISRFNGSTLHE